jgi:hypothetical protein
MQEQHSECRNGEQDKVKDKLKVSHLMKEVGMMEQRQKEGLPEVKELVLKMILPSWVC